MNPVRQPVQHRTCQTLRAAHLCPILERKIGRNNQALPFIGSADNLEQQLRTCFTEWHIAQFIQDQQILLFELFEPPLQLPVFPGL